MPSPLVATRLRFPSRCAKSLTKSPWCEYLALAWGSAPRVSHSCTAPLSDPAAVRGPGGEDARQTQVAQVCSGKPALSLSGPAFLSSPPLARSLMSFNASVCLDLEDAIVGVALPQL